ncbi:CATRA conflict system CASPASE/TPR repeat-associated protein [Actinosynnema sp. NPDC047251]|uniref:Guanylate cyclase domain-containing protein n=1 Tax=Saccharothrix espanaensis (strain ATCC 51144 / DSM 44229 / JCM 9112 / NBRC 15066 / NRRL 15764) TaxID=1179773 RepID=K0K3J1_SACES|nr:CATRA conflict system CASPASE/TPR repeat-associated protein [Saccharothrix espanaensis]CCH32127.1 hypothetical protein BN6_48550 [Saccharothrix espanaensis DSM 44229]
MAAEQELVVHAFAPSTGRPARRGRQWVQETWQRCQDLLGTAEPIAPTGLPGTPPAALDRGPDGPLAAAQNTAVDAQLVLRRAHDVLNLSLLLVSPSAEGLGAGVPPGWIEFDRWWAEIAGDVGVLLGVTRVYQAKLPVGEVRPHLPTHLRDTVRWDRPYRWDDDVTLWEPDLTVGPVRDIVAFAPPDKDPELSACTWSRGDPAMPVLARYLLHAVKLRHHVGVWQRDEDWLTRLRTQVDTHVDELRTDLDGTARAGVGGVEPGRDRAALADELRGDEAGLVVAADRVERMRKSVEIARVNMAAFRPRPLPADEGLAEWFLAQLGDTLDQVERSRGLARTIRDLVPAPVAPAVPPRPVGRAIRMGFMLDVVQYSGRTTFEEVLLQQRVEALVAGLLADLGLTFADTDHQGTGDGLLVFLPHDVDVQRVLPILLDRVVVRMGQDNTTYRDRLRLRLALDVGPVGVAALGFGGKVALVMGRLLDSGPLRQAVLDHPDADVVAMVSDRLHDYVVAEGAPGLDPERFERVSVAVKTFEAQAWLWRSNDGS